MLLTTRLIYASKCLRSLTNGAISCLLIFFYYRNMRFQDPKAIALSWALLIFAAHIKTTLLLKYARQIRIINIQMIAYLLQLITLIIINALSKESRVENYLSLAILILGFIPADGE